jgi:predicted dehydrogenase
MTTRLGWGILATGRIAGIFAQGVARSQHSRLVAVGSRTAPNAARFAKEFGVPRAHGSYEALLADPEVQAVYIAVPHPQHVEWAVRAAEAGKHILCEKPIGLNHAELMVMAEAARANNVLLMEAFMYRCHPQTAKIVEIVRSGVLGEIRLVQAAFGFNAGFNATSRLWSNAAAGWRHPRCRLLHGFDGAAHRRRDQRRAVSRSGGRERLRSAASRDRR